jgi:hypothetical protein
MCARLPSSIFIVSSVVTTLPGVQVVAVEMHGVRQPSSSQMRAQV